MFIALRVVGVIPLEAPNLSFDSLEFEDLSLAKGTKENFLGMTFGLSFLSGTKLSAVAVFS